LGELTKRILSGVLLATVLLGDVWVGEGWFAALLLAGFLVALREFIRLIWRGWPGARARGIWVGFGVAYLGAAVWGLWTARSTEDGFFIAMLLFILVWATDIGAYAFGRAIGGPRIAPSISPSKTWAGYLGACVTVMVTVVVAFWWKLDLAPTAWSIYLPIALAASVLIVTVAQGGDFFESWLKRRAGMKDSGALIPGHGGLLDRIDGLLPVAILFGVAITTMSPET